MTQSLGEHQTGRLLHRSPALARRREEAAGRARPAPIDAFGCAATAPPIQLRAFDDAMVQLHEAIAVGNHEVWGDPLPAHIQMKRERATAARVQAVAADGVRGAGGPLPHATRIQEAFGRHDVSGVRAHLGDAATHANASLGALGYTRGTDIAFARSPDLHLAAHEAAHVVQQRAGVALKGGVGQIGDVYERHADEVADAVVQGRSAESILDRMAGMGSGAAALQCKEDEAAPATADPQAAAPTDDAARLEGLLEEQGQTLRTDITKVKAELAAVETKVAEAKAAAPASDDAGKEAQADALAKLEEERTALAKKEAELEDSLVENDADLQIVKSPGSDETQLARLAAKLEDGASIDNASESETTVGLLKGVQSSDKDTQTIVSGDATGSKVTEKKEGINWHGYDASEEETTSFEQGDHKTEESTKRSTHADLSGVSTTDSSSQKVDDHEISDASTTAFGRGDGKGTVSNTRTHKDGTVDKDGELVEGTETKTGTSAEATLNGNQAGLGANATAERTTAHKGGVKTGVSGHCGGNVTVQVLPVEEGEGYQLVITVRLAAGVGASASGTQKNDGEGGVSGGVKASGSVSKTFTRNLSAEAVGPYLASLDKVQPGQAGTGEFQELGVIATAWKHGWSADSVQAVMDQATDDPEALKKMQKGESNETVVQGGVSGEAGVNGKNDDFGGGVTVSGEAATTVTNKFTDQGDATEMEAQVEDELGGGIAAEATIFKVNVGASYGTKDISGTGVTFSVPKNDPKYAEIVGRLKGVKTQADVAALQREYPQLQASETKIDGEQTSNGGKMGVGGVNVSVASEHGQKHTETIDEDGLRTDRYQGHANTGGALNAGDLSYGSSQQDSADVTVREVETTNEAGEVEKQQQMSGDLQTVKKEGNLTDSINEALLDKDESAAQTALGGGEKAKVVEDENTQGMFADNADMDQLIGEADDASAWQKHCADGNREDWIALGSAIRAAKGDKKAVAAAIASFLDADASGRNEYLQNVIRPAGSNKHGSSYEFPGHLAAEKATYKRLVDADPTGRIAAEKAKDEAKGIASAKDCLAALEKLEVALASAQDQFQDSGTFGEMMRRIANRKQQVTALLDLGEKGTETARYNELLGNCQRFKYAEDKDFAEILANFDGERETDPERNVELENNLKQLYLDWDPAFAELATLGEKHGFAKPIWSKYAPAKERMAKIKKGQPPTAMSAEEVAKAASDEREANEQGMAAHHSSDAHAQAQATAQSNAMQAEKAKAVPLARQRVQAAKTKAAESAGWHNAATKAGKPVSPEAQRLAGEGWTKWTLVNDDHTFENACKADYADAAAVGRVADKKVADYQAVQALFDEGKAANQGP